MCGSLLLMLLWAVNYRFYVHELPQNRKRKLHLRYLLLMCFWKSFRHLGKLCVDANIVWQCSAFNVFFLTFLYCVWEGHCNWSEIKLIPYRNQSKTEHSPFTKRYRLENVTIFSELSQKPDRAIQCHFKWIGSVKAITILSFHLSRKII